MAFSLYKTHDFYIGETTKEMYLRAKNLPVRKTVAKLVQCSPRGAIKLHLIDEEHNSFDINLGRVSKKEATEKAQEIIKSINNNSDECVELE